MKPFELYYSPGACSLAPHVILEEIGEPFELRRVSIRESAHLTEAYRRIHPLQRVPALVTAEGVLTEVSAILHHLADVHPARALVPPPGTLLRARSYEWASFLGSTVHVAFAQVVRARRFTLDESAWSGVQREGRASMRRSFEIIEAKLEGRRHVLGDAFSVCDPYLFVMHRWGDELDLGMESYPRFAEHARRVRERPAVQRALATEAQ